MRLPLFCGETPVMEPLLFPEAATWAVANFAAVALGREDRQQRLVFSTTQLALHPGNSLPAALAPKQLRCFYHLLHRREATPEVLQADHFALTRQAMTVPEPILVVHDTTELDFTAHPALHEHLGPIGDGRGRGLLQHNSLAVRGRDGLLLGLAHQQLVLRRPAPQSNGRRQSSSQRQHRERESRLWKQGFAGVGAAPKGVYWIDVCDRGADIFEALHAAVALGHHALIRACQDRCVQVERDGQKQPDYLMQVARRLPAQAADVVAVAGKGGRPAREAQVRLAACPVWIEPPKHMPGHRDCAPVQVWVERIWEVEAPAGVVPLEWVLLSTLPAGTEEELRTRRDWYARRWTTAEDYHQAEKTGVGEEKVRFQDGQSLRAILAVLAVVAVRVVQLRQVERACPEAPAEQVATPLEIALVQEALGVAAMAWTVTAFVRGVAKLGGFLGRKCDGKPGWKTLWRGYQKLQTLVEGVHLGEEIRRRAVGAAAKGSETAEAGKDDRNGSHGQAST
jgi:hypothetical protein